MIGQKAGTSKLILLTALVIALFMALPRIVMFSFLMGKSMPRMEVMSWWDLGIKCFYTFAIAWVFLWVNIAGEKYALLSRTVNFSKIGHRLALNAGLLILIKVFFYILHIPGQAVFLPRVQSFLFNISFLLEASLCVLIAELYRLLARNQQQALNNKLLLKATAEARFEALKNQINPHFLFNSLNTIHAVIDEDVVAAKKFVGNMALVYRYILNSVNKPVVTLAEEIEFTTAYVKMLLERHANSLLFDIDIPDRYLGLMLPPASLQTLIENAVKHNVVSIGSPLSIRVWTENGRLIISNEIHPRKSPSPASTGTGLVNLYQRYLHLCGAKPEICAAGGIFQVSLPLLTLSNGKYVDRAI